CSACFLYRAALIFQSFPTRRSSGLDYIIRRHSDGDMFPPSQTQYEAFLTSEWGVTQYLEFRLKEKLIGVAVCDRLDDGLSAVYRSEEHTSELQSRENLVCRLLLEKK